MEATNHAVRGLIGAAANGVSDREMGKINDLLADLPGLEAQINVFAIHDELRVEESNLREELSAGKKRCARHPVDFFRHIVLEVLHQVLPSEAIVGEQATDERVAEERSNRIREASAGELEGTVGVKELGSHDSNIRIILKVIEKPFNCPGVDDGIAV